MRRDYFTCVFLGLIAGALAFVFFTDPYFTFEGIVPRDFSILERLMSVLYALFFIVFLPFFAAFQKKEWINWGLAAYGLLIYIPKWFYPAEALAAPDAGLATKFGAMALRGVYSVMQAPFAALSKLIGNGAASKIVYWLLPIAVIWPILFRIIRFYRRAYLSEQLNPMTHEHGSSAKKATAGMNKPEVLGTVISAPVTAQTPADVTRNSIPASYNGEETRRIPALDSAEVEKNALGEGAKTKAKAGLRAPVRQAQIGSPAEENKVAALEAGTSKKSDVENSDEPIFLGAPAPKADEAIPMPPPKSNINE